VTYNGSAVEGATVVFAPESASGSVSTGVTDAQGNFTLTAHWGAKGAVPGSCKVTISKSGAAAEPAPDPEDVVAKPDEEIGDDGLLKQVEAAGDLPAKYASAATAGLTAEVKAEGGNSFKFELTDD